ncbi:MAG: GGDEF domain-containing protein [Firmicutes bacterium]|nr:GGDEF domain-containing protein [Bacillota bacterium]
MSDQNLPNADNNIEFEDQPCILMQEQTLLDMQRAANQKRIPFLSSLQFRVLAIFLTAQILLTVITLASLVVIYQNQVSYMISYHEKSMTEMADLHKEQIDTQYIGKARMVSKIIASLFCSQQIDRWLEPVIVDQTETFPAMTEHEYNYYKGFLKRLIDEHDSVTNVYVTRITLDRGRYVFDTKQNLPVGWYGLWEEAPWDVDIGFIYSLYHDHHEDLIPHSFSESAYFGHIVTVYTPIRRPDGSIAAHAAADVDMDTVLAQQAALVARTLDEHEQVVLSMYAELESNLLLISLIMFLVFVFSLLIAGIVAYANILKPINKLVNGLRDYKPGHILQPQLSKNDELSLLEQQMIVACTQTYVALKSLKQSEGLTSLMMESYPLGCFVLDIDQNVLDCNSEVVKIFSLSSKDEFKEKYFDLSPVHQPCGCESSSLIKVYLAKAVKEGAVYFKWRHKLLDGSIIQVETSIIKARKDDKDRLIVYTRDISSFEKMKDRVEELKKEAGKIYIDGLTGIFNRRFFDESIEKLLKFNSRSKGEFSLLAVDIDYFKNYNDTYGHTEGDNVLKQVALTLTECINREEDVLARYGGEEFFFILPDTDAQGAKTIAIKVLEKIRELNIEHSASEVSSILTVSIGVASGKISHAKTAKNSINIVDKLLYESKRTGRNRYTFGRFIQDFDDFSDIAAVEPVQYGLSDIGEYGLGEAGED